jgi:uncharacterized protein with GYD domain
MGMYLTKFSHTPETWARLLANPEDRRAALGPVFEAAGGRLHGYWYAFGDSDGFVLFEAPDDVITAGLLVRVASAGHSRVFQPPSCSRSKKHSMPCARVAVWNTAHRARQGTDLEFARQPPLGSPS